MNDTTDRAYGRPLKIIQAIDATGWGGAEKVVVLLSNGLARRGHEVEVWMRENSVLERYLSSDVTVRTIPFINDYDPLTIFCFLRAFGKYDIIDTHLGRASKLSGVASRICRGHRSNGLICHMHSTHKPKHYRGHSRIVAVSRYVDGYLRRTFPWDFTSTVIYNGIEQSDSAGIEPFIEREGGTMRVGLLATFKWEKGHEDLVKSFKALSSRHRNVELLLGGDGPLLPRIRSLVEEQRLGEKVRFLGFVPPEQAKNFWKSVDIGCFPSKVEGLPLSLLEAMRCGCAVVAYDGTGIVEAVEGSGVIVPNGDVSGLADALETLVTDRERISHYSELSIQRSAIFSDERMVDETLSYYRKVLDQH